MTPLQQAAQALLEKHLPTYLDIPVCQLRKALANEQAVEPVATVQCINGVTVGYLDVMQPVGTKLFTHSATPATGARAELIEKLRWAGAVGGNETCTQAADMLEADAQGLINFDTWQKNPYTVAMHKSIAEDYVPKQAQQVAVPAGYALVPIEPTDEAIELLYGPYLTYAADESRKRSYKEMLAAAQGAKPVTKPDSRLTDWSAA